MLNYWRKYQDIVTAFIITVALYFGIRFLWGYFDMPSQQDITNLVTGFFTKYGLIVVFLSAIIESILLIGGYFPGSLVIFLGVASSVGNPVRATCVVILAVLGMIIGYSVDYVIGKNGGHRLMKKIGLEEEIEIVNKKVNNRHIWSAFALYIIPGSGSILSTSFGILKINYFKFLTFIFITVSIWNTIWGIVVYHFGMKSLDLITNKWIGIVIICAMFIYFIYSGKWEKLQQKFEEKEKLEQIK